MIGTICQTTSQGWTTWNHLKRYLKHGRVVIAPHMIAILTTIYFSHCTAFTFCLAPLAFMSYLMFYIYYLFMYVLISYIYILCWINSNPANVLCLQTSTLNQYCLLSVDIDSHRVIRMNRDTHPTSRAPQHRPQILVEVFGGVLVMDLHLEHAQAYDPGNEARERRLACPAHPYQQEVALRLAEDTVDT